MLESLQFSPKIGCSAAAGSATKQLKPIREKQDPDKPRNISSLSILMFDYSSMSWFSFVGDTEKTKTVAFYRNKAAKGWWWPGGSEQDQVRNGSGFLQDVSVDWTLGDMLSTIWESGDQCNSTEEVVKLKLNFKATKLWELDSKCFSSLPHWTSNISDFLTLLFNPEFILFLRSDLTSFETEASVVWQFWHTETDKSRTSQFIRCTQ